MNVRRISLGYLEQGGGTLVGIHFAIECPQGVTSRGTKACPLSTSSECFAGDHRPSGDGVPSSTCSRRSPQSFLRRHSRDILTLKSATPAVCANFRAPSS